MGYLKSVGTAIIYIGFFLAVITFLPGLPPEAEYSEYSIKQPSDAKVQFDLKNRLQGAEVLFSGELIGPESFASYGDGIYTGIRGGYVVKIEDNRIKPIVKFGKKCDGLWQEEKCGRPLDLRFNDKGELFVADAYYGIFKVNVNTRQYVNIVNSSEPIDGKVPKLINSLDIAKNGDIYWTDSTTEFSLQDGMYSFLANPSGRLIRYNAATKQNEILLRNLGFANGVMLSEDESFVIVLECLASRIVKYNLKGPKAGQKEIFAESLPGLPDNVHRDKQGGFLVSFITYIDADHPFLPQSLMPHPYIRKMFSRLLYSIEAPFKLLQDVYPNYYAEKVVHTVGSFDASKFLDVKKTSVVLRMDKTGRVLDALYSEDGKVHSISSAFIHDDYLWLGSPWNDYVMRVPLKQAFPDIIIKQKPSATMEQKKEEPLLTSSGTPNVKVETVAANVKPTIQQTTPQPTVKPTAKKQATQKLNTEKTTAKPTTPQPSSVTPKPATVSNTPKASTNEIKKDSVKEVKKDNIREIKKDNTKDSKKDSTKEDKKDNVKQVKEQNSKEIKDNAREIKKDNIKEIKKDNAKEIKKDDAKDIKKDNAKEIKKDNSNVDTKPQVTKKGSEGTVKSENSGQKSASGAQPAKSKPVEQKNESVKK